MTAITPSLSPPLADALDHDAPYVVEKLVKIRSADSPEEANLLFREAKRYLVLAQSDVSVAWPMFSLRVDEAWHQFVLFTVEYAEFCMRYFGRFVHHAPSNAPRPAPSAAVPRATFDEFRQRYRELFGEEPPRVWHDEKTVTADRRLINEAAGKLTVTVPRNDTEDMCELLLQDQTVLFRVSAFAADALAFVARTGAFYVRELPGDLTEDERVALAAALVAARILRAGG